MSNNKKDDMEQEFISFMQKYLVNVPSEQNKRIFNTMELLVQHLGKTMVHYYLFLSSESKKELKEELENAGLQLTSEENLDRNNLLILFGKIDENIERGLGPFVDPLPYQLAISFIRAHLDNIETIVNDINDMPDNFETLH